MLCNYQDINDYCANKFSYQYYDVVNSNPGQLAPTGNSLSPVIRTDKDTGDKIVLYPNSTLTIEPCSSTDDALETISAWQCYQLYLLTDNAVVAPADISLIKNKQTDNVNADFYSSLNDGLIITIDGYNPIVLKTSIEDQVHYGNIAMLANMLYAEDTDNPMPALLDFNNVAYYLSYSVLNEILTKYFNTFASKKYIKDDSVKKINSDNMTLDDINLEYFCVGKIPSSYTSSTFVSSQDPVIKEPPLLPFDDEPSVSVECSVDGDCWYCQANGNYVQGPTNISGDQARSEYCNTLYDDVDDPLYNATLSNGTCCDGTCYLENAFCILNDAIYSGPYNSSMQGCIIPGETPTQVGAVCCNGELVPDYPGLNPCA